MAGPFRLPPAMGPESYRTYEIRSPLATHYRDATCAEVDCEASAHGWRTTVDVATELGRKQANYIRLLSARSFTVVENGTLVEFTFPPGQTCFAQHKVPVGRPEFYRVREGDHRPSPRGDAPRLLRAADWVDDFANHQDKLKTAIERG